MAKTVIVEKQESSIRALWSIMLFILLWTSFANFWYSIDGIETDFLTITPISKEIEKIYPGSKIVSHDWQYFSESVFNIRLEDNTNKKICLDSSIWHGYEFEECE